LADLIPDAGYSARSFRAFGRGGGPTIRLVVAAFLL
jgi:hypothetical protein